MPDYADNNHWMNILQIKQNKHGEDRESLMRILNNSGIQTRPVWHPNHLQRPFNTHLSYKIENALELVNNSLCIPSSTNLSTLDQQKVIKS